MENFGDEQGDIMPSGSVKLTAPRSVPDQAVIDTTRFLLVTYFFDPPYLTQTTLFMTDP